MWSKKVLTFMYSVVFMYYYCDLSPNALLLVELTSLTGLPIGTSFGVVPSTGLAPIPRQKGSYMLPGRRRAV